MTPEEELSALRKEVALLRAAVLDWKEAWFHQREIIGNIGYDSKEMIVLLCKVLSESDVLHWKKQSRQLVIAYLQRKVSGAELAAKFMHGKENDNE